MSPLDDDAYAPLPSDIWRRMMAGEITAREATVEARECRERRAAFNDQLRQELMRPAVEDEREQQERLRARLFNAPEQPRDEGGRFAAGSQDAAVERHGGSGFDGGTRGQPRFPTERERVSNAIETLMEHRANEYARLGPEEIAARKRLGSGG